MKLFVELKDTIYLPQSYIKPIIFQYSLMYHDK